MSFQDVLRGQPSSSRTPQRHRQQSVVRFEQQSYNNVVVGKAGGLVPPSPPRPCTRSASSQPRQRQQSSRTYYDDHYDDSRRSSSRSRNDGGGHHSSSGMKSERSSRDKSRISSNGGKGSGAPTPTMMRKLKKMQDDRPRRPKNNDTHAANSRTPTRTRQRKRHSHGNQVEVSSSQSSDYVSRSNDSCGGGSRTSNTYSFEEQESYDYPSFLEESESFGYPSVSSTSVSSSTGNTWWSSTSSFSSSSQSSPSRIATDHRKKGQRIRSGAGSGLPPRGGAGSASPRRGAGGPPLPRRDGVDRRRRGRSCAERSIRSVESGGSDRERSTCVSGRARSMPRSPQQDEINRRKSSERVNRYSSKKKQARQHDDHQQQQSASSERLSIQRKQQEEQQQQQRHSSRQRQPRQHDVKQQHQSSTAAEQARHRKKHSDQQRLTRQHEEKQLQPQQRLDQLDIQATIQTGRSPSQVSSMYERLTNETRHFAGIVSDLESVILATDQASTTPEMAWKVRILMRSAEETDRDLLKKIQQYETSLEQKRSRLEMKSTPSVRTQGIHACGNQYSYLRQTPRPACGNQYSFLNLHRYDGAGDGVSDDDDDDELDENALRLAITACTKLQRDYNRSHEVLNSVMEEYERKQRAEISLLSAVDTTSATTPTRRKQQNFTSADDEDFYERAMRERDEEIRRINQEMNHVNEIYNSLASIVEQQQPHFDRLDENIQYAKENVKAGAEAFANSRNFYASFGGCLSTSAENSTTIPTPPSSPRGVGGGLGFCGTLEFVNFEKISENDFCRGGQRRSKTARAAAAATATTTPRFAHEQRETMRHGYQFGASRTNSIIDTNGTSMKSSEKRNRVAHDNYDGEAPAADNGVHPEEDSRWYIQFDALRDDFSSVRKDLVVFGKQVMTKGHEKLNCSDASTLSSDSNSL